MTRWKIRLLLAALKAFDRIVRATEPPLLSWFMNIPSIFIAHAPRSCPSFASSRVLGTKSEFVLSECQIWDNCEIPEMHLDGCRDRENSLLAALLRKLIALQDTFEAKSGHSSIYLQISLQEYFPQVAIIFQTVSRHAFYKSEEGICVRKDTVRVISSRFFCQGQIWVMSLRVACPMQI